ncbi:hypothetical protein HMPREF1544_04820 [Mucor circinelloides 1006PhL]|uniref:Uncharacterized protein n=1 Tax=Mucor circinelloides f. circinelloides (strain 1006PhL) TaxID=1220926 RepID=S2JER5_MUCC1|nr:hypothetical protein HMPREF1544_04820 [Mucor circinelloides 1006PhL]
MKSAHTNAYRKIPSIKEQDEYETEDDDESMPKTPIVDDDEDDENIPLAMLAFRKGFIVPDRVEHVYPLIQHVPQKVPMKSTKSTTPPMHTCNHTLPIMYNYSAILPPTQYSENHPQQQQRFYSLNQSYSHNSTLGSTSSVPSFSSSSETLASNGLHSRHWGYHVNKAQETTSTYLCR